MFMLKMYFPASYSRCSSPAEYSLHYTRSLRLDCRFLQNICVCRSAFCVLLALDSKQNKMLRHDRDAASSAMRACFHHKIFTKTLQSKAEIFMRISRDLTILLFLRYSLKSTHICPSKKTHQQIHVILVLQLEKIRLFK